MNANDIQDKDCTSSGAQCNQNARDKTVIVQASISFNAVYASHLHTSDDEYAEYN